VTEGCLNFHEQNLGRRGYLMTELFDEEDSLIDDEICVDTDAVAELEIQEEVVTLDARRRLDNLLEQRRLREELDDFAD
jgi:hypothetical protein